MRTVAYDRAAAAAYAKKWAYARNPAYYDFSELGGDCTNFVSQCIYAGSGVMNYTPVTGWFYISLNNRAAAWTGVEYLYKFIVANAGPGPYGRPCSPPELEIGDFVQLGRLTGEFYHTPIVTGFDGDVPLVAAHSYDAYDRPITDYTYELIRYVHIEGVRRP